MNEPIATPSLLTVTAPRPPREPAPEEGFDESLASASSSASDEASSSEDPAPATPSDGDSRDESAGVDESPPADESAGAEPDDAEAEGNDGAPLIDQVVAEVDAQEISALSAVGVAAEPAAASVDDQAVEEATADEPETLDQLESSVDDENPQEADVRRSADRRFGDEPGGRVGVEEPERLEAPRHVETQGPSEQAESDAQEPVAGGRDAAAESAPADEAVSPEAQRAPVALPGESRQQSREAKSVGAKQASSAVEAPRGDADAKAPTNEPTPPVDPAPIAPAAPATSDESSPTVRPIDAPANVEGVVATTTGDTGRETVGAESPRGVERAETRTQPVDAARFVGRVSRAFEAAQDRGGGPIQIRLSPPELGSLSVRLEVTDGVLTATLETETHAARNLLLDNLPALRERLAEQQIRVEQFDVDVRDENQAGNRQAAEDRDADGRAERGGDDREEERGSPRPSTDTPRSDGATPPTITFTDDRVDLVA